MGAFFIFLVVGAASSREGHPAPYQNEKNRSVQGWLFHLATEGRYYHRGNSRSDGQCTKDQSAPDRNTLSDNAGGLGIIQSRLPGRNGP